jgi:hypothetical protein
MRSRWFMGSDNKYYFGNAQNGAAVYENSEGLWYTDVIHEGTIDYLDSSDSMETAMERGELEL